MFLITLERDSVITRSEHQLKSMGWKLQDKAEGFIFNHSSTCFRSLRKTVLVLQNVVFKINILTEDIKNHCGFR